MWCVCVLCEAEEDPNDLNGKADLYYLFNHNILGVASISKRRSGSPDLVPFFEVPDVLACLQDCTKAIKAQNVSTARWACLKEQIFAKTYSSYTKRSV